MELGLEELPTTHSSSTTLLSAKISVYYMHFYVKICEEEATSGR